MVWKRGYRRVKAGEGETASEDCALCPYANLPRASTRVSVGGNPGNYLAETNVGSVRRASETV